MKELLLDRWRTKPFAHQVEGVKFLLDHPCAMLADEPRCGKSKQVIDTACILAMQSKIDAVIVVAPAYARGVWCHPEVGQIKKHAWYPSVVLELHKKSKLVWMDEGYLADKTIWTVTNYEALRSAERLHYLIEKAKEFQTLLVCDESSYLFNRTSQQTKAILKLRAHCQRVILLNGTPGQPLDQWSQMNVLSPKILKNDFHNFLNFRAEYCNMENIYAHGGRKVHIVARRNPYKNVADLNRRTAPYVLRRLKKDCLDLPPKIGGIDSDMPIFREVPLTAESWKRYKQLRRDAVIALGNGDLRLEPNAAVRILRLQQLTSGILGNPGFDTYLAPLGEKAKEIITEHGHMVADVSSEKLNWCVDYLRSSTAQFTIVWTRWRRERERLSQELMKHMPAPCAVWQIYGGQPKSDRELAVQRFMLPETTAMRHVLIAQPAAGGFAIDLPMASEAIYLSNTRRLIDRLQSEERPHSANRSGEYTVMDVLATGPGGERTIDHIAWDQLRAHKEISDMTAADWRKELSNDL